MLRRASRRLPRQSDGSVRRSRIPLAYSSWLASFPIISFAIYSTHQREWLGCHHRIVNVRGAGKVTGSEADEDEQLKTSRLLIAVVTARGYASNGVFKAEAVVMGCTEILVIIIEGA